MSRRDGIGEVDGWCHECGKELPEPYTGETDLCERCAARGLDPDPEYIAKARAFWTRAEAAAALEEDDELDAEHCCPHCHRVHISAADDERCEEELAERRADELYGD